MKSLESHPSWLHLPVVVKRIIAKLAVQRNLTTYEAWQLTSELDQTNRKKS
jgi:hypothetical protein